jgi:hypothetical protein
LHGEVRSTQRKFKEGDVGQPKAYSRKVASEEAREGYIMVLKGALAFFPALGKPFEMRRGRSTRAVRIESRPCTCRGPDKPHEHYFIRWNGLNTGDRIAIRKKGASEGAYVLTVARCGVAERPLRI